MYSKFQTVAARQGADRNNNIVLLRIGGGDWRRRQLWRDACGGGRMRAARILPSGLNAVRIEAGQCQCTLMTRRQLILHRGNEQVAATAAAQNRALHNSFLFTYPHSYIASTTAVPTRHRARTPYCITYALFCCNLLIFFLFLFAVQVRFEIEKKNTFSSTHNFVRCVPARPAKRTMTKINDVMMYYSQQQIDRSTRKRR